MRKVLSKIKDFKKNTSLFAMAFFFVTGIILWGAFNTAMEKTNTLEFCISCHEMESTVYQEYKHSTHFTNSSGVRAICSDCHVPKDWVPKVIRKIRATNELYHWMTGSIDTPEKFEARRHELASRVWDSMKATDSRECRNCHQFSVMALENQARFAARIHGDAADNGKTCIDCHQGITHNLPAMEAIDAEAKPELDMDYAEEINETCAGCHGEFGEGTINGEYPRLAGMDANYLAKQLRLFKTRERHNIPMIPFTTERELPEEDVLLIATYLAQIELPTKLPPIDESKEFDALERLQKSGKVVNVPRYSGNVEAGRNFYQKECAGCHADDAWGDNSRKIPQLAGQYSIYLKRQIDNFRKAERLHDDPRDADIFKSFSDREIRDLLAYLSILDDE
ncbi:MAG: NapC/NirT family cytochrome c [Gammaproteobacteria bacterium]|nr:NapC/NirT family cytochrome c [Gammaproteobacteria bacterium]